MRGRLEANEQNQLTIDNARKVETLETLIWKVRADFQAGLLTTEQALTLQQNIRDKYMELEPDFVHEGGA